MTDPNQPVQSPPPPPQQSPFGGSTGTGYPGPYNGPPPQGDAKTMAMLAHLLGILLGFLGPLIIWLIKKNESPFVDDQGKEALNFQLTAIIGWIVCVVLACVTLGVLFFLPFVWWVLLIIFSVMACVEANKGVAYRYPINIRFIR